MPIPQQVARLGAVSGKCLPDLLRGPGCSRMGCDVDVNDAPAVMGQDDGAEEKPEGGRGNNEEIAGRYAAQMVLEEGAPGCDGGLLPRRVMYLATVASATSWPRSKSSERMRGAPQSGFSWDIRRISRMTCGLTHGRPLDFHFQK